MITRTFKRCSECGRLKETAFFRLHAGHGDGFESTCVECLTGSKLRVRRKRPLDPERESLSIPERVVRRIESVFRKRPPLPVVDDGAPPEEKIPPGELTLDKRGRDRIEGRTPDLPGFGRLFRGEG